MKNRLKKEMGVTLIALIITIIVLLILAGVAFSSLLGSNGLLNRASDAGEKSRKAAENEEIALQELDDEIAKWANGTREERSLADKIADAGFPVDAIDSLDDVVDGAPIPKGFTVESSNKTVANGLVIRDTIGNEFVWIPATLGTAVSPNLPKYEKWNSITNYTAYESTTDDAIPSRVAGWGQDETSQITKYGGFYIARYSAGLPTSFTADPANAINRNLPGVPLSMKNQIPWNFIEYSNAKTNAESMYHESYLQSGLLTGKMYDTVMKWLENNEVDVQTDSKGWGNFVGVEVPGITSYSINFGAQWTPSTTKPIGNTYLIKTGNTEYTKRQNIYDLAGNLWEMTNENISTSVVVRGGNSYIMHQSSTAAYRLDILKTTSDNNFGFRVRTLYQIIHVQIG